MKRVFRAVRLCVLHILLLAALLSAAAAETAETPAWEKHLPPGGQLDDTAFPDVQQWLAQPHSSAEPYGQVAASTIVANARSLVGVYEYVYGGESPEEGGFDCTGLVWYVYNRMSGLNITLSQAGRSKAALADAGEKIYDHDAFLPGDVIQFTYAHVAIYVGDGRVVHARTTGTKIQETDLNYANVEYAVRYPGVIQNVVVASGTCGESLTWELREDGILTVSGKGAMTDFTDESAVPWSSFRSAITGAVLESGVTTLGDLALYNCTNLKSFTASGITGIGRVAFFNCTALTDLSLPDTLLSIGSRAFSHCKSLAVLDLPDSLTTIDAEAFSGCSALASVIMPDTLTALGDSAFENCTALVSIRFSDKLEHIIANTFLGCTSLTSLSLGSSAREIGDMAFYGCSKLAAIILPKSLENIGAYAFSECSALRHVTYTGLTQQWQDIDIDPSNTSLLSITPVCTGKPDTPAISLSFFENGVPLLTWDEVKYADNYEIWRMAETGEYELIATVTATAFADLSAAPGTMYFYAVRACTGELTGDFSDVVVYFKASRGPLGKIPE